MALKNILSAIFKLWQKTYISLFPFIFLISLCFNSNVFSHNIIIALLLYLPGIYLSNIILLKLSAALKNDFLTESYYYSKAYSRLFDTLILFLGLAAVFIILILFFSAVGGLFFGLITALLLLIIYSYLIFAYPLVVVENLDPLLAIKTSFRLINHHLWLITGIFISVGILEGLIYLILFILTDIKISSVIYNLLFTSLNLSVAVIILSVLKTKPAE